MQEILQEAIETLRRIHRNIRRYIAVLLVLAILTALAVNYRLRRIGISMTADYTCGYAEEHTHTDACRQQVLLCGTANGQENAETQRWGVLKGEELTLYRADGTPAGTAEPVPGESISVPDADPATTETADTDAAVVLRPGHIHTDACYAAVLTCGRQEHTHSAACYADPAADVETQADWEASLPDPLPEAWPAALTAVAGSQLSYSESARNYRLSADGTTRNGYTRYGAWYGSDFAYLDWDYLFAAFCLNYAAVPQSTLTHAFSSQAMLLAALADSPYLLAASEPARAGDLVLYADGGEVTIGIVTVSPAETDAAEYTVISGDVDGAVAEVPVAPADVQAVVSVTEAYAAESAVPANAAESAAVPETSALEEDGAAVQAAGKALTDSGVANGLSVTVKKDDGKGGWKDWTDKDRLQDGDRVQINMSFETTSETFADGSDTLTYQLPSAVVVGGQASGSIISEGKEIGTFVISESGLVTLTFHEDYIQNYQSGIKVNLSFSAVLDKSKNDNENQDELVFPGTGTVIPLETRKDISVEKKGETQTENGELYIDYTVTVSSEYGTVDPVTITDIMADGQEISAALDRSSIRLTKNGQTVSGYQVEYQNKDDLADENDFRIADLPALKAGESYVLTYRVRVTGADKTNGSGSLKNTAYANDAKKAATVKVKEWRASTSKSNAIYDEASGTFTWTVTVKNPLGSDLNGYRIADALETDGTAIQGGIVLKDADGKTVTAITDADGKTGFSYTFPQGSNSTEYTFTYTTTAPGEDGASVTNRVISYQDGEEWDNDTAEGVVGKAAWAVDKSGAGYSTFVNTEDPNIKIVYWSFDATVASDEAEKFTIQDWLVLPNNQNGFSYGRAAELDAEIKAGLSVTLMDGTTKTYEQALENWDISIQYYTDGAASVTSKNRVEPTDTEAKVRSFTIQVQQKSGYTGSPIHAVSVSRYYTYADISQVQSGEKWVYQNNVKIGTAQDDERYSYEKKESSIRKQTSAKDGSWGDTASVEINQSGDTLIYYKLTIGTDFTLSNEAGKILTVTDTLPDGLTLDGSWIRARFHLYGSKESDNGVDRPYSGVNKLENNVTAVQDGQTVTFTIDLSEYDSAEVTRSIDAITLRYRVRVDTQSGEWNNDTIQSVSYTNSVSYDGKTASAKTTVERSDENVEKASAWDDKSRTASYTVTINPHGRDLLPNASTLTLTDTLTTPANVTAALDRPSVRLYDLSDTDFSDPLPDTLYTLSYTAEEKSGKKSTYTLTLTVPDSRALVLRYAYVLDDSKTSAENLSVSNEAALSGVSHAEKSAELVYERNSASATATASKLTVYKVDSKNAVKALPGAEFELAVFDRDRKTWTAVGTLTTNADGELSFGVNEVGTTSDPASMAMDRLYRLRETSAPSGYKKSDTAYYIIWYNSSRENETAAYRAAAKDKKTCGVEQKNVHFGVYGTAIELDVANEPSTITIQKSWASGMTAREVTVELRRYPVTGTTAQSELVQTCTLNAGNSWQAVYSGAVDDAYYYYVVETTTGDSWQVSYSDNNTPGINGTTDTGHTLSVYNEPYTSITVSKLWQDSTGAALTDALPPVTLQLYRVETDADGHIVGTAASGDPVVLQPEDGNWSYTFRDLRIDNGQSADRRTYTYYVVETMADGKALQDSDYTASYSNRQGDSFAAQAGGEITITNTRKASYELPETGGAGTNQATAAGAAIMAASVLCGLAQKRRRRKGGRA